MKKGSIKSGKVVYTDEPMEFTIIQDFLPPPDKLMFTEEKTRVTINLNQSSVDFFKREAKRHHTQYQKIIRSVLDHYVSNASGAKKVAR
jgi:predicted DNA binding CopG/RHH family protein